MTTDEELDESVLGTQEYWNSRYKTDVNNFRSHGDVGDVWFGEESIDRVCLWILKSPLVTKDKRIIDLGCGNGMFLVELARHDFSNLLGIDYSNDAIVLASEIAKKEDLDITYKVFDILSGGINDTFDIVHDKGTYDAVSLSSHAQMNRKKYIDQVNLMLETGGLFVITSCNWTQEELEKHFVESFKTLHVIPTPQFKFGGHTGNVVTSIVFQKIV